MAGGDRFLVQQDTEPEIGDRVSLGGIPGRYIGGGRGVFFNAMTGHYDFAAVQDPKDVWLGDWLAENAANDPVPSIEVAMAYAGRR